MIVRGVELDLHPPPDYVSDVVRATGDFYEADVLDELAARLQRGPVGTIVDAGAMIGNHTAYLAAFVPHRRILAFEPVPANLERLRRNVEYFATVEVHPFALSSRPGPVQMTVDPGNLGHGVIVSPRPRSILAEAITLDSLELVDVVLLKVDVEGHEPHVLAGGRRTIDRWHPLIVIEDWQHVYGDLLPGYRVAAEWERTHQTFLYEWAA